MLSDDIKFYYPASRRPDDTQGGQATSQVIQSGVVGNLVAPVSDAMLVKGNVMGYKVIVQVDTPNQDVYYTPWAFVAKPPANEGVGVVLLYTGSAFDTWAEARAKLEQYLGKDTLWPGKLLELQGAGQRSIQIYQRPGTALPIVGEVYVLTKNEGQSNAVEEFRRATRISTLRRTLRIETSQGNYRDVEFDVVTLEIDAPLSQDFDGGAVNDLDSSQPGARFRGSRITDAVRVHGIKPLAVGAGVGDSTVFVESLYHPLVPSTQVQTALPQMDAARQAAGLIAADNGATIFSTSAILQAGGSLWLGSAFLPGSLSITTGAAILTDDGKGVVYSGTTAVGTANYTAGVITWLPSAPTYSGAKTVSFRCAAAPTLHTASASIGVDTTNRDQRVFVLTLDASRKPSAKSLKIAYFAGGKLYELYEQGNGSITGVDSSYGSGSYRASTHTVEFTVGAVVDPGTEVVITWGVETNVVNRANGAAPKAEFLIDLDYWTTIPESVEITWNDGSPRSATANGAGVVSGDATGSVNNRYLRLTPTTLTPSGTEFSIGYQEGNGNLWVQGDVPGMYGNAAYTVELPDVDITPGSVSMAVTLFWAEYHPLPNGYKSKTLTVRDDGAGGFVGFPGASINYATGTIAIDATDTGVAVQDYVWVGAWVSEGSATLEQMAQSQALGISRRYIFKRMAGTVYGYGGGGVSVYYRAGVGTTARTKTVTPTEMAVDLAPNITADAVPGSLRLSLGGQPYVDDGAGRIITVNPATGGETLAGAIDYATRRVVLTAWPVGQSSAVTVAGLATRAGRPQTDSLVFMAPSRPLIPGSLQILATTVDGDDISVIAPDTGIIDDTHVAGYANFATGIAHLRFGDWIVPVGHESDAWYDADNIRASDGKIWKPAPVWSDSIRFNAVATSYMPVDAAEIGVNPSRFPGTGEVPIFEQGRNVVVHNEQTLELATPITPGSEHLAGRVRLYRVQVVDATGADVPASATTWAELRTEEDGLKGVKFASSGLNLSAYTQPLSLIHQVLDQRSVLDADLSGRIVLNRPLSHEFAAGQSYISSAIALGNMLVSVPVAFTQTTWTGEWSDARIGSEPSMQYQSATFPIELADDGAIQERWAFVMQSSGTYQCVGENLGVIAQNVSINSDFAPANPLTGLPYFTARAGFLGLGGSAGNVFRWNSTAAQRHLWPIVTVLPGEGTAANDAFSIQVIGNAQ